MIRGDACAIDIINDASKSENDNSRSTIYDSRITLQIVVCHFYDRHDDRNMCIIQVTGGKCYKTFYGLNKYGSIVSWCVCCCQSLQS
jgi:hypothetical protein